MMEEQPIAQSAPFPAPPPFYKHFTKPNLARLRQIRKEADVSQPLIDNDADSSKPGIDVLALPVELRYFLPPPVPTKNNYRSFGATFAFDEPEATLQDAGIEQLYPSDPSVKLNPQPHLLALARSLLTTFLSLVGILSANPELHATKVENLQTILYNMHDLINQYRPHQARESLILMTEERIERMREEMRRIAEAKERVGKLIAGMKDPGKTFNTLELERGRDTGASGDDTDAQRTVRRQRAAWAAIEREVQ